LKAALTETPLGLHQLTRADLGPASAILAAAFRSDPIWSRLLDSGTSIGRRTAAFEAPLRFCRRYGVACATSPSLEGVAAFLPGESADMTFVRMALSGGILPGIRLGLGLARRLEPVFRQLPQDRKQNTGGRPYFYLLILGVAPEHQGRGFGCRLLRPLIERSRELGRLLYLETETEANVRMYERFGFRTVKQITLPELDLPMWEMMREPG
jgi:ribosomal protein S18 acetylase RimI-like enzyme